MFPYYNQYQILLPIISLKFRTDRLIVPVVGGSSASGSVHNETKLLLVGPSTGQEVQDSNLPCLHIPAPYSTPPPPPLLHVYQLLLYTSECYRIVL